MKKNRLLIIISVIMAISSTVLTFTLIPNNKKIIKHNTTFNTQERTLVGEQTLEEGESKNETLVPIEEIVEPNEENIETITKKEKEKETNKKPTTNKTDNKSDSSEVNNNKSEEIKLETPTLQVGHGSKDIEMYLGFTIAIEGYYSKEETLNEISGWELYEKINDKYNLVGTNEKYSIDVTIDVGETKTYVARTFILNKEGEKVYSKYSNEYIAINK